MQQRLAMTAALAAVLSTSVSAQPSPAGPWDAALHMHSDATAKALDAYCLDSTKGAFGTLASAAHAARAPPN